MYHKESGGQVAWEISREPGQCFDPSGGESDYDNVMTGHRVLPGKTKAKTATGSDIQLRRDQTGNGQPRYYSQGTTEGALGAKKT